MPSEFILSRKYQVILQESCKYRRVRYPRSLRLLLWDKPRSFVCSQANSLFNYHSVSRVGYSVCTAPNFSVLTPKAQLCHHQGCWLRQTAGVWWWCNRERWWKSFRIMTPQWRVNAYCRLSMAAQNWILYSCPILDLHLYLCQIK